MEFKTPGHAKDVAAFRAQLERVAPDLGCDAENLGAEGPLGLPMEVLGKTLKRALGEDENLDFADLT